MPKKRWVRKYLVILRIALVTGIFGVISSPPLYSAVDIKLIVVNGSDGKEKEVQVKHYLPKELEPKDVLDAGPLDIDYDVNKGMYYVHGDFMFKPKESREFRVRVSDVWRITQEEIEVLRHQLEENMKLLEGSESYDDAVTAKDKIEEQLDFVLAQQNSYAENTERRIEQYRAYVDLLNDIRSRVYNLDFFQHEAKLFNELGEPENTIKFVVEVQNPSETESRDIHHKHLLPKEVRSEHIIDKKGFAVRFDEEKGQPYLGKEETFQPQEKKRYTFYIKDIWHFSSSKLEAVQKRADLAMSELKDSVYAESGQFLFDAIMESVNQIQESLSAATDSSVRKHIGNYRLNTKRFATAEENLERLEDMMAVIRAKKLEELEGSKVKNILQKMRALRGLSALSEALFKRGISVTATWRIIFGTIIFIAIFTTLHFTIWARRSKRMGEEMAPKDQEGIKEVPKPGESEEEEEA